MQPLTSRKLLAGATALLVMLSACGGGDEEAKTDTGSADEAAAANGDDATTTTAASRAACTPTALTEAVAAEYADATITKQSCSSGFGIALITATGLDGSVAFFRDDSGTWVFLTTGAVDAATGDTLPEGFPKIVFDRWIARQLAPSTPVTTGNGPDGETITGPDGSIPAPPATTTTLPPTTTTATTAPPQTATTERQLDPYCIEFPEEASCIEDPYLD